jgi:hypothetical protein
LVHKHLCFSSKYWLYFISSLQCIQFINNGPIILYIIFSYSFKISILDSYLYFIIQSLHIILLPALRIIYDRFKLLLCSERSIKLLEKYEGNDYQSLAKRYISLGERYYYLEFKEKSLECLEFSMKILENYIVFY